MEYVYAAMMLHAAEKDINDDAVTAVLAAAGVDVDAAESRPGGLARRYHSLV